MWSRAALQALIGTRPSPSPSPASARWLSQTTCLNTVVVERWWQVPLSKEDSPPRLYTRRHQVYKVVEDKKHSPKEKMELILTQTVAKLGGRGDTVFVKKSVGRNKLLAQNLAVYPSPQNKLMFAEELRLLHEGRPDERVQTRTGQLTVEFLKNIEVKIQKQTSIEYDITKEIVCRQILKKRGILVPPHALRLPDEPIRCLGDYWCEITVNGVDTVRVPMSVVAFEDPSASHARLVRRQKQEASEAAVSEAAAASEAAARVTPVAVAPAPLVTAVPGVAAPEAETTLAAPVLKASAAPEAAAPVIPEASAAPPAPEASAAPPAPEASSAPPAPEAVAAPPAPEASSAPPAPEVSSAPPAPEVSTTPPAPEVSTTPPSAPPAPEAAKENKVVPPTETQKKE